jgi:hypothetical protein
MKMTPPYDIEPIRGPLEVGRAMVMPIGFYAFKPALLLADPGERGTAPASFAEAVSR